jgi:hypothetical protein
MFRIAGMMTSRMSRSAVIGMGRSFFLLTFILFLLLSSCQSCHGFQSLFPRSIAPTTMMMTTATTRKQSPLVKIQATRNDDDDDDDSRTPIDVSLDPRLYRVKLSRAMGIEYVPRDCGIVLFPGSPWFVLPNFSLFVS